MQLASGRLQLSFALLLFTIFLSATISAADKDSWISQTEFQVGVAIPTLSLEVKEMGKDVRHRVTGLQAQASIAYPY